MKRRSRSLRGERFSFQLAYKLVEPGRFYLKVKTESPFGKAVLGAREGDRVTVAVSNDYSYVCEIRHIEKGADDGSAPILQY